MTLLVPGLIVWLEAILLRVSADMPSLVGPAIAVLGTMGLFVCVPWLSNKWVFRLVIASLTLLMLARLLLVPPLAVERGFVVIPRTLTISLAEWLLACQALILWRWHSSQRLPISFSGLALVTLVLTLNKSLPKDGHSAYVFLVTVSLLIPILTARSQSAWSRDGATGGARPTPRSARVVVGMVCVGIWIGSWLATQAWSQWLPDAQRWFATTVGRTISNKYRIQRYATSGTLSSIRSENLTNPNQVALRVYSDRTPGYLAGRTFDLYRDGHWLITTDLLAARSGDRELGTRTLQPLVPPPGKLGAINDDQRGFQIDRHDGSTPLHKMGIENDPRRGRVYFTPLGCRYVVGAGDYLDVDVHDIVRAGLNLHAYYYAYADMTGPTQPLSEFQRQVLLSPPVGIDRRVADLARHVCRDSRSTREKIVAVRNYFQDNFQYSLKPVNLPGEVDPLNHFLLSGHAAHCEFFASGAVTLLRLQGVPARYATGYRVVLQEEGEPFWTARNRDAHAWAEAYDQEQQKWVIVEATPGFADPAYEDLQLDEEQSVGASGGRLALTAERAMSILQWWYTLPWWQKALLALVSIATLGVPVLLSRRRAWRLAQLARDGDPRIARWRSRLRVMDRRLKRHGLVRHRAETLHQFARRVSIAAAPQTGWLQANAQWYLDYANTRFQQRSSGPPPLPPRPPRRFLPTAGSRNRNNGPKPHQIDTPPSRSDSEDGASLL